MNLAFFLTSNTSLQLWKDRGWLDGGAAAKSYNTWAGIFDRVYFLSYGDKTDLQYTKYFRNNVAVLPRKIILPSWLYSLIIPFSYRGELKTCDIFCTAQMEGAWAAAIAKYIYGKKFVLRCGYQWGQSDFGPGLRARLAKFLAYYLEMFTYHAADIVIVTSESAKERVINVYGIDASLIKTMRNPVDTSLFKPLSLKRRANSIIYVGRLEKEKNPQLLLEAVSGLDVTVDIYGSGSQQHMLEALAGKLGVRANFHGNVPAKILAEELNTYEIFVIPSLYENSPKAMLEAMSCGLPVIGTDVRGINEVIVHKQNGYLCRPIVDDLRQAIKEVLHNEELKQTLGQQARSYVLENCNLDAKIEAEINLFRKLTH